MLDTLLAYPQSWFGPTWPAVWTLVKIMCIVRAADDSVDPGPRHSDADATVGLMEVRPL